LAAFHDLSIQRRTGDTQNLASIALVPTHLSENRRDVLALDLVKGYQARRLRAAFGFARAGSRVFPIHWDREQICGNGVGSCQYGRTSQDVFELADVSRPGVVFQTAPCLVGDMPFAGVLPFVDLLEQMLGQCEQVLHTLAQGGQMDRDHVETIVELLSKSPLVDHLAEIAIGGGGVHTTKPKATGLGLGLVKRVIEEHGGTVELTSDTATGTRVVLRLPLRAD
jgi:two-component sensor histidine kinase